MSLSNFNSNLWLSIQDLLAKVDPEKFKALFGADVSQAQSLIETKALTISKLVRITILSQET